VEEEECIEKIKGEKQEEITGMKVSCIRIICVFKNCITIENEMKCERNKNPHTHRPSSHERRGDEEGELFSNIT
jgi:hypothetical protein